MYILHIETSTRICSVALSYDGAMVSYHDLPESLNHGVVLAPSIEELLRQASLLPGDLSAISVSSGPGSYTGLRVGSSMAKGMAYSLGIPILGVPTLLALAGAAINLHPDADFVLPMLDARRKEVFTALYDKTGREIWPVASFILQEEFFRDLVPKTGKVVFCGDGALKVRGSDSETEKWIIDSSIQCSARHLIAPATKMYTDGHGMEPLSFVPYYIKPPNITHPKKAWPDPA